MGPRLAVLQADITTLEVEAAVNAANSRLAPGGGVCGAIHRAAGPELARACEALGGCPTGQARLTPGFRMPARWVIHTVGPVWRGGGEGEDELLAACYRESLRLAAERGIVSLAFPALSTGIFGFPPVRAARIAVREVSAFLRQQDLPEKVLLVAYDAESHRILSEALLREQP